MSDKPKAIISEKVLKVGDWEFVNGGVVFNIQITEDAEFEIIEPKQLPETNQSK